MSNKASRKDHSHKRILDVAARAIRRSGYDGVGVADIMKEAGLTHGGFYAHFSSRNALLAEAMERAGEDGSATIIAAVETRRDLVESPFRSLIEAYLSDEHLNSCEFGCPLAALASEIPRQSAEVRAAADNRVMAMFALVQQFLPTGTRDTALVIASTLVGAMQLARAMKNTAAAKSLLAANRAALLHQYDEKPIPN